MSFKSFVAKQFAAIVHRKTQKWASRPVETQFRTFRQLMKTLSETSFGKEHGITPDCSYETFKEKVPVRDYEGLKSYFERIKNGEADVMWKGKPVYLAKTSGTTSGAKYIPITKDSIGNHIRSARNGLLAYIHETGNSKFLNGKLIFLSGSPVLDKVNGIFTGRLSGIVNHHVPGYLRSNQVPSWETNCIEDWEQKVDAIVQETLQQKMTFISGIPPWVQMYFDRLMAITGKKIKDIFPHFSLFVYGGVNFEPYRAKLEQSIGKKVDTVEFFPASEGFFAYQNKQGDKGLLLLLDEGILYEFIPANEFFNEKPTRISIKDVELGVNYVLIINSNAGLWGYNIGDTVKFVSKSPYKVIVSGRIKHYISAFGEHVIGEEVEYALQQTIKKYPAEVIEFTVAPYVSQDKGQSYHEWLIEFAKAPANLNAFAQELDRQLQQKNIYYRDLITGNILAPLELTPLPKNAFIDYMKREGKLGGQNKVPRLSNDRKIADGLKGM